MIYRKMSMKVKDLVGPLRMTSERKIVLKGSKGNQAIELSKKKSMGIYEQEQHNKKTKLVHFEDEELPSVHKQASKSPNKRASIVKAPSQLVSNLMVQYDQQMKQIEEEIGQKINLINNKMSGQVQETSGNKRWQETQQQKLEEQLTIKEQKEKETIEKFLNNSKFNQVMSLINKNNELICKIEDPSEKKRKTIEDLRKYMRRNVKNLSPNKYVSMGKDLQGELIAASPVKLMGLTCNMSPKKGGEGMKKSVSI